MEDKMTELCHPLYQLPTCPICLGDMHSNLIALTCGHCFHNNCIIQYINGDDINGCPNCRLEISNIIPIFYEPSHVGKASQHVNQQLISLSTKYDEIIGKMKQEYEDLDAELRELNVLYIKKRKQAGRLNQVVHGYDLKLQKCQKLLSESLRQKRKLNEELDFQWERAQNLEKQMFLMVQRIRKLESQTQTNNNKLIQRDDFFKALIDEVDQQNERRFWNQFSK